MCGHSGRIRPPEAPLYAKTQKTVDRPADPFRNSPCKKHLHTRPTLSNQGVAVSLEKNEKKAKNRLTIRRMGD